MVSYQLGPDMPGLGQELMGNVRLRPNYLRPATFKILQMGVNPLSEPTYCLDMEMMTATKFSLKLVINKKDYNDDYEDRIKVQFL